jgi:hypothetical protein
MLNYRGLYYSNNYIQHVLIYRHRSIAVSWYVLSLIISIHNQGGPAHYLFSSSWADHDLVQ